MSPKSLYQKHKAILRLTRWKEYYGTNMAITALGIFLIGNVSSLKISVIMIANLLSYAFAFMINDIEDAQDDALDPNKVNRNPISAKLISYKMAYFATISVAVFSLLAYFYLGDRAFLFGVFTIILGFLYSWKKVRLKALPLVDVVSHGFFLGTLNFLAAVSLSGHLPPMKIVVWLALSLFTLSVLGDIGNELRDFATDQKVGIRNTAHFLNLYRVKPFLVYLAAVPLLCILVFLLLYTSIITKMLLTLVSALFVLHFYFTWFRQDKVVFEYPYKHFALLAISLILLLNF